MRDWAGPEMTKFIVNVEVQKARVHRRPFWKHVHSQSNPPPRDPGLFMEWLRGVAYRKNIRLPRTFCVFRNHCEGEDRRFHYILKVSLSDEGYFILKAYAGDRGIPHSKREQDYPWKYGSLPDNRVDFRRAVPVDPAGRLPAFPPEIKLPPSLAPPPTFAEPRPPVLSRSMDPAGDLRDVIPSVRPLSRSIDPAGDLRPVIP